MVEKKLIVLQMLPELESGGVEQGTLELSSFLAKRGHISLVISRFGPMVKDMEEAGGIHIDMPHIGEKSLRPLLYFFKLRRLFSKVDVLHLRSRVPAWAAWLAWKSLPEAKRPLLITTFHGIYSKNPYSAIMTYGEGVIAVSESVYSHILENYSLRASSLSCIYRGADSLRFNPEAISEETRLNYRRSFDCDEDTALILLPARFSRKKGHDLLLKALKDLLYLKWKLVFVGNHKENPAYTKELEELAEDFKDRLIFASFRKDMPELLAASDLVVSASTWPESFGRTMAEAGMMKRAVIASAHGGSLEIVRDGITGLLFKSGDLEKLRDKLELLIKNPSLREFLGENASKRIRENFTIETMCRKTLKLYQYLLKEKRKGV